MPLWKINLNFAEIKKSIINTMKKILFTLALIAVIMLAGGCQSMKEYAYFQNIDTLDLSASKRLPDVKVMPKDELSIIVKTTNQDAAEPFNLYSNDLTNGSSNNNNRTGYLVDNEGNINFPVIGKVHVGGLTKNEVEDLIKDKISPYLAKTENPVVICRMSNFHITVIGETGSSNVIDVPDEKISIVDALAKSGDIGLYGKRTNVLLVRQDSTGEKHIHRYNMDDARIFNDPYYYLQQNDLVYVQPSKQKAVQSSMGSWTTLWLTILGWVSSVAAVVVAIVK